MLRIGLTGGIGAGKSTVSATFSERGAVVVDGDVISREVVEPGTEGLAALVEAFGEEILLPDGALNRPALAAVAFSDDQKRATLNGIVHPLVGKRREELIAAAPADAVIVEDIPLLVESHMAPFFPLVIIVHAEEDVRVARLVEHRGFSEEDARARIKAQATEAQRRAVADVWLDNASTAEDLKARAVALWDQRILPFAHNVDAGVPAEAPGTPVPADPEWPAEAGRIVNRLRVAAGDRALRVDHVGPTAVLGLDAEDVIDVQVTVPSLDGTDELGDALRKAGYVRDESVTADVVLDGDQPPADAIPGPPKSGWQKRFHASADPGRPTRVHVRVDGQPNQRFALLWRDWMNAHPGAHEESWSSGAFRRAWAWADAVGWRP